MHKFYQCKEDIEKWLNDMEITNYSIRENNIVDVYQDIKLFGIYSRLPIQFGVVDGDFNCAHRGLITLEGSPYKVNGTFKCNDNYLTSLKHAPQEVGHGFDCSQNELTSLEHIPEKIGTFLFCTHNKLTTLKGCPQVGSSLDCSHNSLTSMVYCPSHIKNILICSYNSLTSFDGFPEKVDDFLFFNCNNIEEHELVNFYTKVKGEIKQDIVTGTKNDFLNKVKELQAFAEKQELLTIKANIDSLNNVKKRL